MRMLFNMKIRFLSLLSGYLLSSPSCNFSSRLRVSGFPPTLFDTFIDPICGKILLYFPVREGLSKIPLR